MKIPRETRAAAGLSVLALVAFGQSAWGATVVAARSAATVSPVLVVSVVAASPMPVLPVHLPLAPTSLLVGAPALTPAEAAPVAARAALLAEAGREADAQRSTLAQYWSDHLEFRAGLLRATARKLTVLEQLAAGPFLASEARALDRERQRIERDGLDSESFFDGLGDRGLTVKRAGMLRDLRGGVPGLDPDRVIDSRRRFEPLRPHGSMPTAYTIAGRFVWIGRMDDADFVLTAAHEGTHQGDRGYAVAESVLTKLYGAAGHPLANVLIEGFTEWRTHRVLEGLLAGRSDLGRDYSAALRRKYGGDDATAQSRLREDLKKHDYDGFVAAVAAIVEKPGGREALDALVSRGDPFALVDVLGDAKMRLLAEAATGALENADGSPVAVYLARAMRVNAPLRRRLADVVTGRVEGERIGALSRDGARLLRFSVEQTSKRSSDAREWILREVGALDLGAALEAGTSVSQLEATIEKIASVRDWRRFVAAPSPLWRSRSGRFAVAAAVSVAVLASAALAAPPAVWIAATLAFVWAAKSWHMLARMSEWSSYLLRRADSAGD